MVKRFMLKKVEHYLKKLLYSYKLNLVFKSSCIFVLRQWCSCFGHTIRCFHRDLSNYECYYECFSDWFILSLLNCKNKHLIVCTNPLRFYAWLHHNGRFYYCCESSPNKDYDQTRTCGIFVKIYPSSCDFCIHKIKSCVRCIG